jgi:HlyD family secretion protein
MKKWWLWLIIVLVVVGGIWFWRKDSGAAKGAGQYRMGLVDKGQIQTVVTATGTVSAVTTVQVGSQVSGVLRQILVDFNSPVKKGQVVARIDPTFLQAAVNEAEANLSRAKATLDQAQRDLVRTKDLYDKKLAAQSDYDSAVTAVALAQAGVAQTQAQLDRAKVNLAYAVITSPIDGTVISRSVDVGQTVAASLQAPTLFTIAQDLSEMQVASNIDEADIGGVKEGMEATFTVDAFPDETFHGKIQQIRYAAQTDQGVVTYPVIVNVKNPDLKLRPGMTANVTVVTAHQDDVLRAPATALRFRPADVKAPTAQNGATGGGGALAQSVGGAGAGGRGQGGGGRGGGRGGYGHNAAGADSTSATPRRSMATVWVKDANGKPAARKVTTGLNDGNYVQIISGELSPGDSVIVGLVGTSAVATKSMPGMGGGMGPGGPRR